MKTNDEKVMFTSGLTPEADPAPTVIERFDNHPGAFKLRYGGLIIPDGPGHGTILCVDGIIVVWKLPNKQGHVPVDQNSHILPHMTGQWRGPWGNWPLE